MVVLIEQATAGGAGPDVADLVDGFQQVRCVGGPRDIVRLNDGCAPEPAGELLVEPLRMMHGIAAVHVTAGSVESRELCVRDDRVRIELDQPLVLLLDNRLCAGPVSYT